MLRYRGWKVWQIHDMHISLLAVFYILIVENLFRPLNSLVLILSLGFYFMYGFLINDFFDTSFDIKAGKKRAVHELSRTAFKGVILSVIVISVLFLLYLKNTSYMIIYGLSYLLATLYSAPVIRFKERGFAGIIVNALIEKMLPVLGIFVFFNHLGVDTFIFVVTSFLLQVVEIITHQIYDYEGDLKSGIRTYAVDIGKDRALKIFRYVILPLSIVFMVLLCSLISIKIPYAIIIPALVFITYLIIFWLVSKGKLNMEETVLPLYVSPLYFLINNAFPVFFASVLITVSPLNIGLLVLAFGSQYYLFQQFFKLIKAKVISRTEITDA